MKLFQIEEPDGSSVDPDAPGAAIGIDASAALATVAVAIGGNAEILHDRTGFEVDLSVPAAGAQDGAWRTLFEGARLRAERALARPVTHAVLALPALPDRSITFSLDEAALAAGLSLLRIIDAAAAKGEAPAIAAAILAEDIAPSSGIG